MSSRTAVAIVLAGAVLIGGAACGGVTGARTQPGHDAHGLIRITEVNGAVPPGKPTHAAASVVVQESPTDTGEITVIDKTTRLPGTRAPIHMHPSGGTTCVLRGEMTLYLEGAKPARAPAGTCYFMPPGRAMSGANTGSGVAIMLDIFTAPAGTKTTEFHEAGFIGH